MTATKFQRNAAVIVIALVMCIASLQRTSQDEQSSTRKLNSNNFIDSPQLGLETTFLMGIMSTRSKEGEDRRKLTRDTYLKDPSFCSLQDLINQGPSHSKCSVYYTFVVGGGGDNAPTDHWGDSPITLPPATAEEKEMGDIVILNIQENGETGKSRTWFKYAASLIQQGHPIDYVAKVHSDTLVGPHLLTDLIRNDLPPAPFNKGTYGGRPWANLKNQVMFATKAFYFMSIDLALYISQINYEDTKAILDYGKKSPRSNREEQDIATLAFSIGKPSNWMNFDKYNFWRYPMTDEEQWRREWDKGINLQPEHHILPMNVICPAAGLAKTKK